MEIPLFIVEQEWRARLHAGQGSREALVFCPLARLIRLVIVPESPHARPSAPVVDLAGYIIPGTQQYIPTVHLQASDRVRASVTLVFTGPAGVAILPAGARFSCSMGKIAKWANSSIAHLGCTVVYGRSYRVDATLGGMRNLYALSPCRAGVRFHMKIRRSFCIHPEWCGIPAGISEAR